MAERNEASPEEIRALLCKRAEMIPKLADLTVGKLEEETLSMAAAMVYHAAIRLYGKNRLDEALAKVTKHHTCYLAGVCEMCGEPLEGKTYLCPACVEEYAKSASVDRSLAALLVNFGPKTIQ